MYLEKHCLFDVLVTKTVDNLAGPRVSHTVTALSLEMYKDMNSQKST
jgi:hypothetical protein